MFGLMWKRCGLAGLFERHEASSIKYTYSIQETDLCTIYTHFEGDCGMTDAGHDSMSFKKLTLALLLHIECFIRVVGGAAVMSQQL